MSDTITETIKVRFGMSSTRELEIEVEPGHDIATEFEAFERDATIQQLLDSRQPTDPRANDTYGKLFTHARDDATL